MEHYLGEKLKKLRESRGWTQADLAKRLNKAVSTVSGYESDVLSTLRIWNTNMTNPSFLITNF